MSNLVRVKAADMSSADLLSLMKAANGSTNGISVTTAKALKVPEVLACVNVLAQSMSMLPLSIYENGKDGRVKRKDHPVYKVISQRPNDYQSPLEFMRQMTFNVASRGNAYARKVTLGGKLIALHPIENDLVTPKQLADGSVVYEVKSGVKGDTNTEILTTEDVFHLRGPNCPRGWVAESPIELAKETIASMIAIERFNSRYFTGNAKAKGAFRLPNEGALDDEAFERLKATLDTASGDERVMLLEQGLEFIKMDYSARESMLAEVTNIVITRICRVWRIQPHLIQSLDNATFSNIEHQSREFVDHTLMPWIRLWESSIKCQLMDPYNDDIYPKISAQALLRGDNKTRSEVYAKAVGGPYMTPNQARALEDMSPIEGGDDLLRPLNLTAANQTPEETNP